MADIDLQEVDTKLSAARTRLILERPFLGALVMHLPMIAADPAWCETTATDARKFYYNPAFIDGLSLSQTQFMLAHEALHCGLSHFSRRHHRTSHRWDIACDYAVNQMLIDEGLKPPGGALADARFSGMSAEEIYPLIAADSSEQPIDRHLFDSRSEEADDASTSSPQPGKQDQTTEDLFTKQESFAGAEEGALADAPGTLSEAAREEMETYWRQRLATAAQQARLAGKLGESTLRWVDALLAPNISWRALLGHYVNAVARDDYSFQRPSRRDGDALMPRLHSTRLDVVVAVDTSGSIEAEEMREFLSELNSLKGQMHARVTFHACDDKLAEEGPWTFEDWDTMALPEKLSGGGGTRFTPVFEWLDAEQCQPDVLVYFTDAEGEFPETEPRYPVVWLVKGKAPVPWGQRIQLN